MTIKKIIYIDDQRPECDIVIKRLERKGINCTYFSSFLSAQKEISFLDYDAVLLDTIMPDINGIEALSILRTDYTKNQLPVIMITSLSSNEDINLAFEHGANDYITKPININAITSRITSHIELKNLHKLLIQKKEVETIKKLITTCAHEINNPLTIALMNCPKSFQQFNELNLTNLKSALERIAIVVKKIKNLNNKDVVTENYCSSTPMYRLGEEEK